MKYKTHQPYPHQLDIMRLSQTQDDVALFWEMGTGKTFGLINILRLKYGKNKRLMRTLILSPIVTLHNWQEEIEMHSNVPKTKVHIITGSGAKRVKKLHNAVYTPLGDVAESIIILNYEALLTKGIFDLLMKWNPEIVVGDEIHYVKNYKSKRAKALIKLSVEAKHRFALTGTPILNSIVDIFMQYKFLDNGATFGRNYFDFVGMYMRDENASWSNRPGHFPKLVAREEMYDDLNEKILSKATRIRKADVLKDLPPLIKIQRRVDMSSEQRKMYKEMERDFLTWVKSKEGESSAVVAQLAVTKALRLQQIVTGFVTNDDKEVIEIQGKNPRIEAVQEILSQVVSNHKIILWCCFKFNYKQLGKLCKKMNIEHVFITGEQSAREKQEAINSFRDDDGTRVVIANRRAGGIGINLVEASYSIVYSRNFSLGEELQSEARNHRGGSQIHESVTKIDLVSPETIDEHVLEALSNKQEISNKVIDLVKGELLFQQEI